MALFQSIISDILALSQRFDFPDDGQQTAVDATHVLPLFFTVSGCEGPPPLVRPLPLLSGAGIRAPLLGCHPTWRYTCRTHQRDVTEGLAPSLEVEAMGMRRNSAAAVCKDKTLPSKETYKSSRRLINISVSNFPPPFHSPNYFTLLWHLLTAARRHILHANSRIATRHEPGRGARRHARDEATDVKRRSSTTAMTYCQWMCRSGQQRMSRRDIGLNYSNV